MSRIGKKPITIPDDVEVKIEDNRVLIKGPKGELSQELLPQVQLEQKDNQLLVSLKGKGDKAVWGLTRALLQNHVEGVVSGFEKSLEIIGIGYKASLEGDKKLKLELGFSHPIEIEIPQDINVSIEKNIIKVTGID